MKKILGLVCFVSSLFLSGPINAQSRPGRRYTTSDGLISDRITCITQDEQGLMWIGTYFGLSKYDGYRFITISLPALQRNKYVSSLVATGDAVYAGFLFGGGLMEYRNGKARAFSLPPGKTSASNDVYLLCRHINQGILLAAGNQDIYHFTNGSFRLLFSLDSIFKNIPLWYMSKCFVLKHFSFYRQAAVDNGQVTQGMTISFSKNNGNPITGSC